MLLLKDNAPSPRDQVTSDRSRMDLESLGIHLTLAHAMFGGELFSRSRPEDVQRTSSEIRQIEKEIAFISRVFSGNYNMEVLPSPSGGWACGISPAVAESVEQYLMGNKPDLSFLPAEALKPKQIFYDRDDLAKRPRDENLGVLRHEIGHALHSDYKLFFEGQRLAKDQGYLPSSWAYIHNALEDPWINNIEMKDSPVVREQMLAKYSASLPEIVEKIGTQPLTHQLGLNLIYYWATKGESIPTITDKSVLETFERIKPLADQFFKGKSSAENFELLKTSIWPIYQGMEKKALDQESLKELARQAGKSSLGKNSQSRESRNSGGPSGAHEKPGQSGSSANKPGGSSQAGQQVAQDSRGGQSHGPGSQAESSPGNNPFHRSNRSSSGGSDHDKVSEQEKESLFQKIKRVIFGGKQGKNKEHSPPQAGGHSDSSPPVGSPQHDPIPAAAPADPIQSSPAHTPQIPQPTPPPPSSSEKILDQELKAAVEKEMSPEAQAKLKEELKKQVDEQKKFNAEVEKNGQQPNLKDDINLDKLAPEVRAELEKLVNSLPPELRQKLEKQARQILDDKQAEALREQLPQQLKTSKNEKTGENKVDFGKPPTEREIEESRKEAKEISDRVAAEEAHAQAQAQQRKTAAEQAQLNELQREKAKKEMKEAGFSENERNLYRTYKELESAMLGRIRTFCRILAEHLPKKLETDYAGEHFSGSRLNEKSVIKRAPLQDYRIYQRREELASEEPRMFVTLLIDNSGSMDGIKMQESLKTSIFWGKVLKEFNIPFCIKFFGENSKTIKTFDQDYEERAHGVRARLVRAGTAASGSTNLSDPFIKSAEEMDEARRVYPDSLGAIFVISDSGANRGQVGQELKDIISKAQTKYIVMNFLLATEPEELKQAEFYFGKANLVAPANFQDLPQEAFTVLRRVIQSAAKKFNSR